MSRPRSPIHNCQYRYVNNCYVVKVAIYQKNTMRYLDMLLDTGASYVSVPDDTFDGLGLEVARSFPVETPSSTYQARLGIVEKIILDGVVIVPNVEIVTTPRAIGRLGGLLGGSFLKEVGIYLEPRKKLLRFHYDER